MELRIKDLIKKKGLTITELADKLHINRVNLSNMINGNPTLKSLELIADALEVSVCDLFACRMQPDTEGKPLTALIKYGDNYYSANSLRELEKVVERIKEVI